VAEKLILARSQVSMAKPEEREYLKDPECNINYFKGVEWVVGVD
jgi:hypothetical protein